MPAPVRHALPPSPTQVTAVHTVVQNRDTLRIGAIVRVLCVSTSLRVGRCACGGMSHTLWTTVDSLRTTVDTANVAPGCVHVRGALECVSGCRLLSR